MALWRLDAPWRDWRPARIRQRLRLLEAEAVEVREHLQLIGIQAAVRRLAVEE